MVEASYKWESLRCRDVFYFASRYLTIRTQNKELDKQSRICLLQNLERHLYQENIPLMRFKESYKLRQDKDTNLLIGHRYGDFGYYQGLVTNEALPTVNHHLFFRIEKDAEGYNIVNFIDKNDVNKINEIIENRRIEINYPDCNCGS